MKVSRHGDGAVATARAFASQVHPTFMLPPVAASLSASALVSRFSLGVGAVHAIAIFAAVYTAHVKDGYVDFHVRGEDEDSPLTERGCGLAIVGATTVFVACLLLLWLAVDWIAVAFTAPAWLIAYHHAPQLDVHPAGATLGYPSGIALSILGGYYVQTGTLSPTAMALALVLFVVLAGVKVIDDEQDYDHDLSIDKRTVAVVVGPRRARASAFALLLSGLLLVVGFMELAVFPPSSVLGALAFALVAGVARGTDPTLATMLLIRGSYVLFALLLAAVWLRPLT